VPGAAGSVIDSPLSVGGTINLGDAAYCARHDFYGCVYCPPPIVVNAYGFCSGCNEYAWLGCDVTCQMCKGYAVALPPCGERIVAAFLALCSIDRASER
jgi:hypothetical protein